jgi:hypothetical protein
MVAPTAFWEPSSQDQIPRGERSGDGDLARLPEIWHYKAAGDVGARPGVILFRGLAEFRRGGFAVPRCEMPPGEHAAIETALTERYEALLRISQTFISTRSSKDLFSVLARELRAVATFYVMDVGIYNEKAHEMHTKSYGESGVPLQAPKVEPEETFSWWVYQHQQPLIIPCFGRGNPIPRGSRNARESGGSFGMRASVDHSTRATRGPRCG